MKHFPIFMKVAEKRICLMGNGEDVIAKIRLVAKSEAMIELYADKPDDELASYLSHHSHVIWHQRDIRDEDINDGERLPIAFVYIGQDKADWADYFAASHIPYCVIDDLAKSAFTTPAIVDRAPVVLAIGTEGTAPILARKLKKELEERLPASYGRLAKIASGLRAAVAQHLTPAQRRRFWTKYFDDVTPQGDDKMIAEKAHQTIADIKQGKVQNPLWFVSAGPGDPDLLTMQARRLLHDADVVLHDRLVPAPMLELCRREAQIMEVGKTGFGASWVQDDINHLLVKHVKSGLKVVRLKSGDAGIYGRLDEEIAAVTAHNITYHIAPGITAATAGAAKMGVSFTRRGRNAGYRIITGHDVNGFADYDWRDMAKGLAGAHFTVSVYMSRHGASHLASRLLMHGAPADLAVTIAENISHDNERWVETTLMRLPQAMQEAGLSGPVIIYLGMAPHPSHLARLDYQKQEAAHVFEQA